MLITTVITERNHKRRIIAVKRRLKEKGEKRKMPTEMLKNYIGQTVRVSYSGGTIDCEGTIVSVEENWIMIEEKKNTRIINGDAISCITIKKEYK